LLAPAGFISAPMSKTCSESTLPRSTPLRRLVDAPPLPQALAGLRGARGHVELLLDLRDAMATLRMTPVSQRSPARNSSAVLTREAKIVTGDARRRLGPASTPCARGAHPAVARELWEARTPLPAKSTTAPAAWFRMPHLHAAAKAIHPNPATASPHCASPGRASRSEPRARWWASSWSRWDAPRKTARPESRE
jgi:hypothetical protein